MIKHGLFVAHRAGYADDSPMADNPQFQSVDSWNDARQLLSFKPLEPKTLDGRGTRSLSIHIRDHKGRELRSAALLSIAETLYG